MRLFLYEELLVEVKLRAPESLQVGLLWNHRSGFGGNMFTAKGHVAVILIWI